VEVDDRAGQVVDVARGEMPQARAVEVLLDRAGPRRDRRIGEPDAGLLGPGEDAHDRVTAPRRSKRR
jgi:hypothetical protein